MSTRAFNPFRVVLGRTLDATTKLKRQHELFLRPITSSFEFLAIFMAHRFHGSFRSRLNYSIYISSFSKLVSRKKSSSTSMEAHHTWAQKVTQRSAVKEYRFLLHGGLDPLPAYSSHSRSRTNSLGSHEEPIKLTKRPARLMRANLS